MLCAHHSGLHEKQINLKKTTFYVFQFVYFNLWQQFTFYPFHYFINFTSRFFVDSNIPGNDLELPDAAYIQIGPQGSCHEINNVGGPSTF